MMWSVSICDVVVIDIWYVQSMYDVVVIDIQCGQCRYVLWLLLTYGEVSVNV